MCCGKCEILKPNNQQRNPMSKKKNEDTFLLKQPTKYNQGRQGDVYIVRIDRLPKEAKRHENKGDIILALGEVTGHAHRIKNRDAVEYRTPGGICFIEVPEKTNEPVTITHEEHGEHVLTPGIYEKRISKEYTPSEIRNVED